MHLCVFSPQKCSRVLNLVVGVGKCILCFYTHIVSVLKGDHTCFSGSCLELFVFSLGHFFSQEGHNEADGRLSTPVLTGHSRTGEA